MKRSDRCSGARIAALLCVLWCASAAASDPEPKPLPEDAADQISKTLGPFKLHAGPTGDGTFAAGLDGEGRQEFCIEECYADHHKEPPYDVNRFWYPMFGNLGYNLSGAWSNDSKRPNNASISLKPGIDGGLYYGKVTIPVDNPDKPAGHTCDSHGHCGIPLATLPSYYLFAFGTYTDIEFRDGTFQSGSSVAKARQLLGGGGVYIGLPMPKEWDWVDVHPRLSATFYAPFDTHQVGDASAVLPEGAKENYVQSEFHTTLAFGPKHWADGNTYPFKFDVIYDGSKATSGADKAWKSLWKLLLSTGIWGASQITPVLSYQSGADGSFKYDRQWLLGALFQFLDPKK